MLSRTISGNGVNIATILTVERIEQKQSLDFEIAIHFIQMYLDTLTEKTFTLTNFQRIRGMLRLLGRTVRQLWKEKPEDALAIHLHHIDLGIEEIKE